jgi:protein-disulfide isomerase
MLKVILSAVLIGFSFPVLAQESVKNTNTHVDTSAGVSTPLTPGYQFKSDPGAAPPRAANMEDIKRLPIIQNILQGGAEIYYLGERSGLQGFVIYKSGGMQVFYLPPDQQTLLFGAMFSIDSANVTAQQITLASNQNPQLKGIVTAATEQQREFEKSAGLAGADSPHAVDKNGLPPVASLSPGERLYRDFQTSAGVMLGQPDKPLLLMLVDPLCLHCKATWGALKDHVAAGDLRVRLLPIGPEGSERERMAARLLRVPDPLKTWNKFEEGDQSVLAGDAPINDLAAVRTTMAMVMNWKITATPYLVYRGKDGKIKVVQGEPEKIAAVLADITP